MGQHPTGRAGREREPMPPVSSGGRPHEVGKDCSGTTCQRRFVGWFVHTGLLVLLVLLAVRRPGPRAAEQSEWAQTDAGEDDPIPAPYVGLLVRTGGALLLLFLLAKAYAVSHYSLTTTGALITSAPLTVLLGTVASYLYLLLPALAVGLPIWLWRTRGATAAGGVAKEYRALAFGLALLAVFLSPVPDDGWQVLARPAALVLGLAGLLALTCWLARSALARRVGLAAIPVSWFVVTWVVLLLVPTLQQPWVPAEVLVLRSPGTITTPRLGPDNDLQQTRYPIVHVLSDAGGVTSALDADTRFLLRVPSEAVVLRHVCHHESQLPGTRPVWLWLLGRDYASQNVSCQRLVREHARRLDPLVAPDALPTRAGGG